MFLNEYFFFFLSHFLAAKIDVIFGICKFLTVFLLIKL